MTKKPLMLFLGTAALSLALYLALVQVLPFKVVTAQNQNDTNLIRVQDYLRAPDRRIVLVGSSLTFRLQPAILGDGIANLSLAGDGPRTGLKLIREAGAHPDFVLVETNLLLRPANDELVHSQLRSPEYDLRKFLRAFRTGYDPVNLLWRGLVALTRKSDAESVVTDDIVQRFTDMQRREKSALPDAALVRASMEDARKQVQSLQARGIRVGLLEMPIDASLEHSNFDDGLRRAVLHAFPPERYCWIRPVLPKGVHTLDGIHLRQDDAALVAAQIVRLADRCS